MRFSHVPVEKTPETCVLVRILFLTVPFETGYANDNDNDNEVLIFPVMFLLVGSRYGDSIHFFLDDMSIFINYVDDRLFFFI